MKLSEPITIKPHWWSLFNITAPLILLGTLAGIYAVGTGAWNPFGSVTLEGWWAPILWTVGVSVGAVLTALYGWQLACLEARHAAERRGDSPTPEVGSRSVLEATPWTEKWRELPIGASAPESERDEAEESLVGAGR